MSKLLSKIKGHGAKQMDRITVLDAAMMDDQTPDTNEFLAALQGAPEERLACQVCVVGDIHVEYLGI